MEVGFLANSIIFTKSFSIAGTIEILKNFNSRDKKQFRLFLRSPFFNDEKLVLDLYNYLEEPIRKKTKKLTGPIILENIFGEDSLNESNIDRLKSISELLEKLAKEFLIYKEVKENDNLKRSLLVQAVKRKESGLFLKTAKKVEKQLDNDKVTISNLMQKWQQSDRLFFHQYPSDFNRESKDLQNANRYRKEVNQIYELKYYLATITRSEIFEKQMIDEEMKNALHKKPLTKLAELFQSTIKIVNQVTILNKDYKFFKKLFLNLFEELERFDKYFFIKCAINCTGKAILEGEKEAIEELFYWNNLGMQHKLFFVEGTMTDTGFINTAISAFFVKDYEKIELWKEQCLPYLPIAVKEKAIDIIDGYLLVDRQQYAKAIKFLNSKFPYRAKDNIAYSLRVNALLLYVYLIYCILTGETREEYNNVRKEFLELITSNDLINKNRKQILTDYINFCHQIMILHDKIHIMSYRKVREEKQKLFDGIKNIKLISMVKWLRKAILAIEKP